jgi:hypothetical protein
LVKGGYTGLGAQALVPKPPVVYTRRKELPWNTDIEQPEVGSDNSKVPEDENPGPGGDPLPPQAPPPTVNNNQTASNGPGGSSSGPGDGKDDGKGGEGGGKGPKAPSFGGFGDDSGGGGGGGGGGNGADGGGAPVEEIAAGPRGGDPKGGPNVSAAVPEGIAGGGPVKNGPRATPNETSIGGHDIPPSLASHFDGSRNRGGQATNWSPVPMKGLGAGDSPGLPRLAPRTPALSAPAPGDASTPVARTAGSATTPARIATTGVRPEEEDFSYTYMAPARHKYELPEDRPAEGRDWSEFLSLSLRGAAALSVAYLIYYSDLPYLVGLTRRRRDGTYGV